MTNEVKNLGVAAEVVTKTTINTQPNVIIKVKKANVGRPRKNFTKMVAFVNGVKRGRGKPKKGQVVEWREVPLQ